MSDRGEEIVVGLTEARELASLAVSFDKKRRYDAAVDYYDKAILNIDDALNELPPSSDEFGKILRYRKELEARMELLVVHLNNGGVTAPTPPEESLSDDISEQGNGFLACDDEEMAGFVSTFEADKAPSSIASLPYWQLRK